MPWRFAEPRSVVPDEARPCAVAIMAKVPRSGRVKTRLVPPLTPDQATELSSSFLRDVAAAIASAAAAEGPCPAIHGVAVYLPVGDEAGFEGLIPEDFLLLPQRGADLGERLRHAAADLFSAGFGGVCLVNSDSPTLPPAVLREAAAALERPGDRVVLGPARDGGYYLIGLKRADLRLFEEIAWSTPAVLAQTLERARELGLDVHLLPEWYDVDDVDSLRLLCDELFGGATLAVGDRRGAASRAVLERMRPELDLGTR